MPTERKEDNSKLPTQKEFDKIFNEAISAVYANLPPNEKNSVDEAVTRLTSETNGVGDTTAREIVAKWGISLTGQKIPTIAPNTPHNPKPASRSKR